MEVAVKSDEETTREELADKVQELGPQKVTKKRLEQLDSETASRKSTFSKVTHLTELNPKSVNAISVVASAVSKQNKAEILS